LETTEFVYNNKIYLITKVFLFKANYGQNPWIEFEGKRKGKFEIAEKCHDLAKWLKSLFTFLFFSGCTIQGWSVRKYYVTKCYRVTGL